jgi:hypothetical protein
VGGSGGFRKGGGVGELEGADVQTRKGGVAEERGGKREVERPRAVDEGEFFDVRVGDLDCPQRGLETLLDGIFNGWSEKITAMLFGTRQKRYQYI